MKVGSGKGKAKARKFYFLGQSGLILIADFSIIITRLIVDLNLFNIDTARSLAVSIFLTVYYQFLYKDFDRTRERNIPMNEYLRKEVKMLKALQGISYKELAEYLEVKVNSLYSWLRGNYDFGEDRLHRLQSIISDLKES